MIDIVPFRFDLKSIEDTMDWLEWILEALLYGLLVALVVMIPLGLVELVLEVVEKMKKK